MVLCTVSFVIAAWFFVGLFVSAKFFYSGIFFIAIVKLWLDKKQGGLP